MLYRDSQGKHYVGRRLSRGLYCRAWQGTDRFGSNGEANSKFQDKSRVAFEGKRQGWAAKQVYVDAFRSQPTHADELLGNTTKEWRRLERTMGGGKPGAAGDDCPEHRSEDQSL